MMQQGGLLPSILGSRVHSKQRVSPYARGWLHSAGLVCVLLVLYRTFSPSQQHLPGGQAAMQNGSVARRSLGDTSAVEPVLVSYSYFEKDQIQRSNMEFFMAVGMGMFSQLTPPANTDFVIVISGDMCTPCKALMPMLKPVPEAELLPAVSAAWSKVSRPVTGVLSSEYGAEPCWKWSSATNACSLGGQEGCVADEAHAVQLAFEPWVCHAAWPDYPRAHRERGHGHCSAQCHS
jgi:hypothetical protein